MNDVLIELRECLDGIVDCLDTVFENDKDAAVFLGVARDFFAKHYAPYCGVKQGRFKTYRKSELLRRREQLRKESESR